MQRQNNFCETQHQPVPDHFIRPLSFFFSLTASSYFLHLLQQGPQHGRDKKPLRILDGDPEAHVRFMMQDFQRLSRPTHTCSKNRYFFERSTVISHMRSLNSSRSSRPRICPVFDSSSMQSSTHIRWLAYRRMYILVQSLVIAGRFTFHFSYGL